MSSDTKKHCKRVKKLCEKVANQMEIKEDLKDLLNAASLHDTGKFFIPEKIIKVPRHLTKTERFVIDMHSSYGYFLCKQLGYSNLTCQLVLLHHGMNKYRPIEDSEIEERAKELMPILMMCDIYDAVHSDRPYCDVLSNDIIRKVLHENPEIPNEFVDVLMGVVED